MSETVRIPDEHVLSHIAFGAHEPIPFGWHVFVITTDAWQSVMDQIGPDPNEIHGRTVLYDKPDPDGTIGVMYLRPDYMYVGMVAHESLHLASWMLRRVPGIPPRMTLGSEPEELADLVGALTSVIWYSLEKWWTVDE